MKTKRPTIREVAKLAEVSIATVSNVFSGRKKVNNTLKIKVQEAATELGYQIDRAGSQLRSGRSNVIAVLVPDLTDNFFATIVSHFENLALEQNYDVIVASSHDQPDVEKSRIKTLLSWRPAGLIAVLCSAEIPRELLKVKSVLPMVLVDRISIASAPVDTVTIDNNKAGSMVAEYLFESGHRNILVAASDMNIPPISERFGGVHDTLIALSGTEPKVLELGSNMEVGAARFAEWLDVNPLPTAIFALTDVTTLSVVSVLSKRKLKVPDDVSLVAFDDHAWMSVQSNGLSAIQQPVYDMASNAFWRLISRIEPSFHEDPTSTVLEAKLIKRQSVRKIDKPITTLSRGLITP